MAANALMILVVCDEENPNDTNKKKLQDRFISHPAEMTY